jgi:hypothetical protein
MLPASARLYDAIVHERLTLPDDAEMRQHSANAVARHSRRGWRIDAPARDVNIDSVIALCMALEHADAKAGGFEFLGYLDELTG